MSAITVIGIIVGALSFSGGVLVGAIIGVRIGYNQGYAEAETEFYDDDDEDTGITLSA